MSLYISLLFGVFIFSLIVVALSPIGLRNDALRRRVESAAGRNHKTDILDESLDKPISERIIKPLLKNLTQIFQRYIPENDDTAKKKTQNDKLKKALQQAGFSLSVSEFTFIRLFVIIGAAVLFGFAAALMKLGIRSVLGLLLGGYAGYAILRFYVSSRTAQRKRLIEQQLPDVLDLLSVNVEAGLGFEQSILHVIEHFNGYLVDELMITYREITMGRTRRDALNLFAERCGISEVKTFVGAVVQAGQMGIPLKNVLRTQAAAMRASRKSKVEEKAMKISVKILLPMVLFIFPVIFIVLMGPAVVKIIKQFKG